MNTIIVHNSQGASEEAEFSTKNEISNWLKSWSDPQNLTAVVTTAEGKEVARKKIGRKTLFWV